MTATRSHRLVNVEPYVGTVSSFYVAACSCGWLSDDLPSKEAAEERWGEHEDGRLDLPKPQTSMMGPWGKD